MPSGPQDLFEQVRKAGYSWIVEAIGNEPESVYVEFKEKRVPQSSGLHHDDRENYARDLSALANGSGGVIIWGIKSGGSNRDLAFEEKPIRCLKEFCAALNLLSATALEPPLPGVQNEPIVKPGQDDEGFVITYVPASEAGPHRALCSVNQYYVRTGSTSVMMSHSLLALYFGKRRRANLRLAVRVYPVDSHRESFTPGVCVGLRNVGMYVALYPALTVNLAAPWSVGRYGIDGNGSLNLMPVAQAFAEHRTKFVGGANSVIHPGSELDVCKLDIGLAHGVTKELPRKRPEARVERFLEFEFAIYAQDCEPVGGVFRMDSDTFYDLLDEAPPGRTLLAPSERSEPVLSPALADG